MRCNLFYFLTIFLGSVTFVNAGERPFADAHIHFNWDQAEIISADEVAERMRRQKVGLTLVAGTPDEARAEVRYAIRHAAPGGGLVVTSGNVLQPGTQLNNYLAARQATRDYGAYPIDIA